MRLDLKKNYQTKSGCKVTLICPLNSPDGRQIVGIYLTPEGWEEVYTWTEKGLFFTVSHTPSSMDLIECSQ